MNYSYKSKLPVMSGKQHQGLRPFDFGLNKKDEKNGMPQLSFLQFEKPLFAPYVPTLSALNDTSKNDLSASTPQSDGARIKTDLNLAASKTFGESEGESLFDGIDEKSIELNLSLADSVISSNRRRGAYSAADLDNLPNLRGGLAAFYAAAESGNNKAANAAWKIAYTPETYQEKTDAKEPLEKLSYEANDKKTDPKQVDSYPVLDKENVISQIFPAYEASKELYEHIKTGFDDYDGNTFFDIIAAGATALRLNPAASSLATAPKFIVRNICKLGADLYLRRKKGYDFSADLFEHSLQENPNDLVFYDDSNVADVIRNDNDFLKKIDELTDKIENKTPLDATDTNHKFNVGDMYYSIHGCNVEITNIDYNDDGTKNIYVHISDEYDYTKIWTMMGENGISLGSIANDAGTVSTWIDAINPYHVDIYLTLRR